MEVLCVRLQAMYTNSSQLDYITISTKEHNFVSK